MKPPPPIALLICDVFEQELALVTVGATHIVEQRVFEIALHDRPEVMRGILQQAVSELDARDDISAIVLAGGIVLGVVLTTRMAGTGILSSGNDKFREVINYVKDNYVDTFSRKALEEKAITGLMEKLDPHSVYITAEEFHDATDPLLGKFEGIGVQA